MGKYAKYALVLLYVAQLVVAFREQLVHLYKNAVEATQREAVAGVRARRLPVVSLKATAHKKLAAPQTLASTAPNLSLILAAAGAEEEHDPGEEHKDREKRHHPVRRAEYLLANLYHRIRKRPAHPSATEEREDLMDLKSLIPEAYCAA